MKSKLSFFAFLDILFLPLLTFANSSPGTLLIVLGIPLFIIVAVVVFTIWIIRSFKKIHSGSDIENSDIKKKPDQSI